MANNDFMDQWGPQMLLFGGLGVTGFKVAQELAQRGGVRNPWREQKALRESISDLAISRGQVTHISPEDVARKILFFSQGDGRGFGQVQVGGALRAMQHRFGFSSAVFTEAGINLEQPKTFLNPKNLVNLMNRDKRFRQFLEGHSTPLGKNVLADLKGQDGSDPLIRSILRDRQEAMKVAQAKSEMYKGSRSISSIRPGQALGRGHSVQTFAGMNARIRTAMESSLGAGRAERISVKLAQLREMVHGIPDVKLKLRMLDGLGGAPDVFAGLRIESRGSMLDLPFVQTGGGFQHGTVLMGDQLERRGIARLAIKDRAAQTLLAGGRLEGVGDLWQYLDEEILDNLTGGGLNELFTQGSRGQLIRDSVKIGNFREEVGARILPMSASPGYNRRVAGQLSVRGFEREEELTALVREHVNRYADPGAGLGPSNFTQPVVNLIGALPFEDFGEFVPGSTAFGMNVGGPKGMAQLVKPYGFIASQWEHRGAIHAVEQLETGDFQPRARILTMEGDRLSHLLREVGGIEHLDIHEDELISLAKTKDKLKTKTDSMRLTGEVTGDTARLAELFANPEIAEEAAFIGRALERGNISIQQAADHRFRNLMSMSTSVPPSGPPPAPWGVGGANWQGWAGWPFSGSEPHPPTSLPGSPDQSRLERLGEILGVERAEGVSDRSHYQNIYTTLRDRLTIKGGEHGTEVGRTYEGFGETVKSGESFFVSNVSRGTSEVTGMADDTENIAELKLFGTRFMKGGAGDKKFYSKFTDRAFIGNRTMEEIAAVSHLLDAQGMPATSENIARATRDYRHFRKAQPPSLDSEKRPLFDQVQEARAAARGVEHLSIAPMSKLTERQITPMTIAMAEELAFRHDTLGTDILHTMKGRWEGVVEKLGFDPRTGSHRMKFDGDSLMIGGKDVSEALGTEKTLAVTGMLRERERLSGILGDVGVHKERGRWKTLQTWGKGVATQEGKATNLIDRFYKLADAFSDVTSPGRSRWSSQALVEGLRNTEDMLKLARIGAMEQKMSVEQISSLRPETEGFEGLVAKGRSQLERLGRRPTLEALRGVIPEIVLRDELGAQLGQGAWFRYFGLSEDPRDILGTGKLASVNEQLYEHLLTQGGSMGMLGKELPGRIRGANLEASQEVTRALMTTYQKKGIDNAIDLSLLAGEDFVAEGARDQYQGLFSQDPIERKAAAARLRKKAGIEAGEKLIFDLGAQVGKETGHRYLYHIEDQFAGITEGYITPDRTEILGRYDTAARELINTLRSREGHTDPDIRARAIQDFKTSLHRLVSSKEGPFGAMQKGKAIGGMQMQLQSGLASDLVGPAAGILDNIRKTAPGVVGLSEKAVFQMAYQLAEQQGLSAEKATAAATERVNLLRAGGEAVAMVRYPTTSLKRATLVPAYSIEQSLRQHVGEKVRGFEPLRALEASDHFADIDGLIDIDFAMEEARAKPSTIAPSNLSEIAQKSRRSLTPPPKSGPVKQRSDAIRWLQQLAGHSGVKKRIKKDFADEIARFGQEDNGLERFLRSAKGQEVLVETMMSSMPKDRAYLSFGDLGNLMGASPLGGDTDADQVQVLLGMGQDTRAAMSAEATYTANILQEWLDLSKSDRNIDAIEGFLQGVRGRKNTPEYQKASEAAEYLLYERELFQGLKGKGVTQEPISRESLMYTAEGLPTPEMQERQRAQMEVAKLEKGAVGVVTNTSQFARDAARRRRKMGGMVSGDILQEIVLGILPEVPLKARQPGFTATLRQKRPEAVAAVVSSLKSARPHNVEEQAKIFESSMRTLFDSAEARVLNTMLNEDNVRGIMESAARANQSSEPDLYRAIRAGKRRPASPEGLDKIVEMLQDPTIQDKRVAMMANEREAMKLGGDQLTTHKQNIEAVASDVWGAISKHKKPALIGTGLAVGASMLFGSPGHISEGEAERARDYHKPIGDPSIPPIVSGNSARLETGSSIKIRGRSMQDIDYAQLSNEINQRFPNANIGYNVIDQSEPVNDEYVRRSLMR